MTIGASLLLIAIGAILRFAVTKHVSGVDVQTVGVIVMLVGILGMVLGLVLTFARRRTDVVSSPGRTTYIEPNDPVDPPRY